MELETLPGRLRAATHDVAGAIGVQEVEGRPI